MQIKELLSLLEIILKQNYLYFNNNFYIQNKGLGMGCPLSGLLAEIYMNNFENTHIIKNNPFSDKIISYSRFIDDTFIIFNGTARQIINFKNSINKVNPSIQFTYELENDEQTINFLDLSVTRVNNNLKFKIFRKPTATDTTIHADSYHPRKHKLAAFNSYVYRLLTVPMDRDDFIEEKNTIKYIAMQNGFKTTLIDDLIVKHKKMIYFKTKFKTNLISNKNLKFISAEYTNILPTILNNKLKKLNYVVAFRTNNNLFRLFNYEKIKVEKSEGTGIYKIICNKCKKFYIGQTGRSFLVRYKEHLPKYEINNQKSKFAQHVINDKQTHENFEPSFEEDVEILHHCIKGRMMDIMEEYEIYSAIKNNNDKILNDKLIFKYNSLFELALSIT